MRDCSAALHGPKQGIAHGKATALQQFFRARQTQHFGKGSVMKNEGTAFAIALALLLATAGCAPHKERNNVTPKQAGPVKAVQRWQCNGGSSEEVVLSARADTGTVAIHGQPEREAHHAFGSSRSGLPAHTWTLLDEPLHQFEIWHGLAGKNAFRRIVTDESFPVAGNAGNGIVRSLTSDGLVVTEITYRCELIE